MARLVAGAVSVLAGWLIQHLGQYGLQQDTANLFATAVVSGGIGWATKFYTDWGTKTVPKDAIVTPSKVELPPTRPVS